MRRGHPVGHPFHTPVQPVVAELGRMAGRAVGRVAYPPGGIVCVNPAVDLLLVEVLVVSRRHTGHCRELVETVRRVIGYRPIVVHARPVKCIAGIADTAIVIGRVRRLHIIGVVDRAGQLVGVVVAEAFPFPRLFVPIGVLDIVVQIVIVMAGREAHVVRASLGTQRHPIERIVGKVGRIEPLNLVLLLGNVSIQVISKAIISGGRGADKRHLLALGVLIIERVNARQRKLARLPSTSTVIAICRAGSRSRFDLPKSADWRYRNRSQR